MSRLRTARPDHVAVATAAGAIAAAVVLALVLPGIGLKFVGALTGMAIGYVITKPARYLVMERATKKYRDFVTSDPTRLFPLKPDVEPKALGSRPRLTSSIAAHLAVRQPDPERGPIVVVGEAGSGKTTFAAGLAAQLAREAKAPVIVPLRGLGNEIDFDAVGRERFQQVVRRNRLARDADQLWNYLSSRERCVVIADGLDERVLESRAGDVTDATDEILSSEAARSVPLVITSRPDGLSRARLVEALELEELGEEYVAGLLVDDSKGSLGEEEAREITRQLELTLRPLYLTVARDICRRRERDALVQIAAQDTDLARYRLLDARLDVFMNDGDDTRSQTVDTISMLALIALREGEAQASTVQPDGLYEDWLQAIAGPRLDRPPLLAAAAGELRFLRIDGDRVGFRHPIIQTYLASRAMELLRGDGRLRRDGRTDPEWGPLLKAGTSHEVLRALRMYATRLALSPGVEAGERMDLLTRDLVGHANTNYRNATHRLALLASAAQGLGSAATIRPDAFAEPRASLAELIAHTWDDKCDPATKIDAVRWLARMGGRAALPGVWEIAMADDSYSFRWEVVEAIAASGAAASETLGEIVEPMLAEASEWADDAHAPRDALPESLVKRLSIVAKFLPSGNEGGADAAAGRGSAAAADMTGRLAHVVRAMTARDRGLGVEASLAQGLKHAARRYPLTDQNLGEATSLAADARFWYSRIMAIHALVRHAIAVGDKRRETHHTDEAVDAVEPSLLVANRDGHAWVREAAAQARRALEQVKRGETDTARGFVWHDEAGQIARSSYELDAAVARLLGDVVIELNMNEQGDHVGHPSESAAVAGCETCEHQLVVGTSQELPHCLSLEGNRNRLLGSGGCTCSFKLCPYDFSAYRTRPHAHRGQLSPQFCTAQLGIARELGPPPWQPGLDPDAYVEFWATMRERA